MQPHHVVSSVANEVVEIKRPASMILHPFHDYVGRFPRVCECLPLPRQYHDQEWILVVCATVEGAWPMQVLVSISRAAGLPPPRPSVFVSQGGEAQ